MGHPFFKNKLINDTFFYYTGKIIPGLVGFFSVPIFIRLFGTPLYGEYSLLISTILLMSTFFSGWIGQSFMRFYTKKTDKVIYIYIAYKMLIIGLIVASPIIIIVLFFLNNSIIVILVLLAVYFFLSVFSFLSIELRTKLLSKKMVIADSIRAVTFISFVLMLFYIFHSKGNNLLLLLFFGNLMSYLIGSLILKKKFFSFSTIFAVYKLKIEKKHLNEMLSYGIPIAFWMVTAYLLNISDRYVIKYYMDYKSVGLYSGVYDIFYKFMTFVFMPLLMAFQPIIIKLYNEGKKEKVKKYLKKIISLQIIVFIVLLIIVIIFKEKIVYDFLKLKSAKAVSIVIPIFIGSFIWNISMFVHKPLELKQKTILMLYGVLIAFLINLTGNLIFIPKYGIIAAAYTTLAGTITYLVFILFYLKKNVI